MAVGKAEHLWEGTLVLLRKAYRHGVALTGGQGLFFV